MHRDETDPNPELLVYVLHGFGANAEDLSGIGSTLLRQGKVRTKKARFYVVNAPMSMGQGSYCWWPLNMQDLMMRIFTVGLKGYLMAPNQKRSSPAPRLCNGLSRIKKRKTKIPMSKTVICGFSQGSWLATNIVCESKARPALVLYSSALYRKEWGDKLSAMQGLRVLQYHGTCRTLFCRFSRGKCWQNFSSSRNATTNFARFKAAIQFPLSGIADMDALLVDVAEGK